MAPEKTTEDGKSFPKQIEALQHQILNSTNAHISELVKIRRQAATFQGEIESLRQQVQDANAALQHQILNSTNAHISELVKIRRQAATFQEEIESLRQKVQDANAAREKATKAENPGSRPLQAIPIRQAVDDKSRPHTSFAQFCNFFASGPQLPEEDWYAIVPHLTTQKPSTSCELPLPTEFWEVGDTWGPERASYPSVASDGVLESCLGLYAVLKDSSRQDRDWRNMALLSVRQLMKEMLSRGIVYQGLISLIANMVIGLVETKKLQTDDPLLFAIWQVVACADEMLNHLLSSERRALRDILTGDWSDIARSIEDHKDLRPFDLIQQASPKPGRMYIYYHPSKLGIIVNRDMDSNQRRYIVLDFDTRRLRVVEGDRWDVMDNGTMVGVKLLGNDKGTYSFFEIDKESWELLMSDTLDD